MRKLLAAALLLGLPLLIGGLPSAESACCYFAAKDKDILQPAQKAFLTWDADKKEETFTVQPKFEGNAVDFGMVIPTPTKPKLDEMPRDFFKELAVFTILEPMDLSKYKSIRFSARGAGAGLNRDEVRKKKVEVLGGGVVGTLDYKILKADDAEALYTWLKENKYNYGGDESTLDYYIKKQWVFTVMKIDTMQMKKRPDGSFDGEVTPTRFSFTSEKLIYPLKITQLSVKDKTEALFYIQTAHKVDLPGDFSYELSFTPMWSQATSFAVKEKLSKDETAWQEHTAGKVAGFFEKVNAIRQKKHEPATLEWAKKITEGDLDVLEGKAKYNREAPAEDVKSLKLLKGYVQKGQFLTKMRKVFRTDEMEDDLEFVRAGISGKDDDIEYYSILPTSPP